MAKIDKADKQLAPTGVSGVAARLRAWWVGITFGNHRPGRTVAALAFLGAIAGAGEAALVVLLVAIASGSETEGLPIAGELPSGTWALSALALAVLVGLALAHLGSARTTARASTDAFRSVQTMLIDAFLGAPWVRQAPVRAGELQDLITVRSQMLAYGTREAATALSTGVSVIVLIVAAVAVNAWAALALLVTVGVAFMIGRPFRTRRRRIAESMVGSSKDLAVVVAETTEAARDLRVFGVIAAARARLVGAVSALARHLESFRFSSDAVPALTRDATLVLLVLALALVVSAGNVSLPVLGTVVLLMMRALAHAQTISSLAYALGEREANLDLIRGRLADWPGTESAGSRSCPPVDTIELQDVSFRYPGGEQPALKELSLRLARGERLGVVGRTGAGKSTLAAILLGLINPDSGEVLIDGMRLTSIDSLDWHRRTAWVDQEPHLLTGSVAENIRFMRESVDDAAIARAAHEAGLAPELARWPDGLEHDVGPLGGGLSGGQRQRVALARALAGDPDLLVLDEPTSALDVHAESAFRDTLQRLDNAIIVVIAHRLSTIETCDRVAVMEAGRTIAIAAPSELPSIDRYFREAMELSGSVGPRRSATM
jgi:ABC-type multidrug transport system fused ATPase/permease subunit